MRRWVDPQSHVAPAFRLAASLAVGLVLAAIGGLILGEYTFQGVGIQWMAMSGGIGMGALIAWVLNRVWGHEPPRWMMPVAGILAMAGEALAVQRDTEGIRPWPPEGWAAVALAGVAAAYGIHAANRTAEDKRSTNERAPGGPPVP
jgi:hypothetical protein